MEKVKLLYALPLVLGKTAFAAASAFTVGTNAPSKAEHISAAGQRAMLTHFSAEQLQSLIPNLETHYKAYCTKNNVEPVIVKIPHSVKEVNGYWIGDKAKAKYHMAFYHGGGYVIGGTAGHIDMLGKFVKFSNNKLAILALDYTVSPAANYPVAIGQSVEALRYVLSQPGRTPANTLVGGDSAGGQLALAVLSHLTHPHPNKEVVKPFTIDSDLYATIIVSPWLSSDNNQYPSFSKFEKIDIFPQPVREYWMETYKGRGKSVPDDNYIFAAQADPSWWKGVKTKAMVATVGEKESLVDPVVDWAKKFQTGAGKGVDFELAIGTGETHIKPVGSTKTDEQLEKSGKTSSEGLIRLWLKNKLN